MRISYIYFVCICVYGIVRSLIAIAIAIMRLLFTLEIMWNPMDVYTETKLFLAPRMKKRKKKKEIVDEENKCDEIMCLVRWCCVVDQIEFKFCFCCCVCTS